MKKGSVPFLRWIALKDSDPLRAEARVESYATSRHAALAAKGTLLAKTD
jgi:hypothetical protein